MSEDDYHCSCETADYEIINTILCESCDEWFHWDCNSITEDLVKCIKKFYCFQCRNRNPSLKIRYIKGSFKSTIKQGNGKREKSESPSRSSKAARVADDSVSKKRNNEAKENEISTTANESSDKINPKTEDKSKSGSKITDPKPANDENEDKNKEVNEVSRENEISKQNNSYSKPDSMLKSKTTETTTFDIGKALLSKRKISEVDEGLWECYHWMYQYKFNRAL